jgi:hypothetical protein
MLPDQLTQFDDPQTRAQFKVVRLDSGEDLPGEIISASTITGLCLMKLDENTTRNYDLGKGGLRIVARKRGNTA